MTAFRAARFAGFAVVALARVVDDGEEIAAGIPNAWLEVEVAARIDHGQALALEPGQRGLEAFAGALVVSEVRQSAPGAPAYSWAVVRTADARAAIEAASVEARDKASGAQAPGTAGADGGEDAPARSSRPRPRPVVKSSPPEESSNGESASQPSEPPSVGE